MDKIKKGLGRGLSSLIGETKVSEKKSAINNRFSTKSISARKNF